MSQPQQTAVQPDDAESAIANLHKIMDALEATVKEETAPTRRPISPAAMWRKPRACVP